MATDWRNIRFRKPVRIAFWALLFVGLLAFVNRRYYTKTIDNVDIKIYNLKDNYFLTEEDVFRLMNRSEQSPVIGNVYNQVSIKQLEERIKGNVYVKNCQVARNLQGDLQVKVWQRRPVIRLVRNGKPDVYLDSLGTVMPVRENYTARVLPVTFGYLKELPNIEMNVRDKALLDVANLIFEDEFLKAQIAQIHIEENGNLLMYPQLGNQIIEFGPMKNVTDKFKRLKVYYTEILPLKGWNAYKHINLKFDNQIICE